MYKEIYVQAKLLLSSMTDWWINAPLVNNLYYSIIIGIGALWGQVNVYLYSMFLLTFIDTHFGIKASQIKGIPFDSKKIRKGLLDKSIILMTVLVLCLIVDLLINKVYDFGQNYLTMVMLLFAVIYESTSIVEKLKVLYPNSKLVVMLGKIFMLFEVKLEQKLEQKLEEMEEIKKIDEDN